MFDTTLYKKHANGTVGTWQVQVLSNYPTSSCVIRRIASKVIGGKPVITDTTITQGKNIGKVNETSPVEQANLEAQSKASKKLDEGYVISLIAAQSKVTNSLGLLKPMLAHSISNVKKWDFPIYASTKFDGHRMLATIVDNEVILYSRQGKLIIADVISAELKRAYQSNYWDGTTLDGEIYLHGETLQRISSLVKKPKADSKKLVYYIYDVVRNKPFIKRLAEYTVLADLLESKVVVATQQKFIHTQKQLDQCHADNLGEEYEGTIVRHGDTPYEDGKRSQSLMKKKDFQDAEFEITGLKLGKTNERHGLKVGIYECKTSDNQLFTVTAPGNMHSKNSHAMHGWKNVGKKLTVKFFNYTPDGVPYLPVALQIRADI
jgi:DNA ligase-1